MAQKKSLFKKNSELKVYLPVFFIFFTAILYLFLSSYHLLEVSVAGYKLKNNNLSEYFSNLSKLKDPEKSKPIKRKKVKKTVPGSPADSLAVDTTSQKILIFGDSMLEGLCPRLNDYCQQNNHQLAAVIWYSSSITWYGSTDTIAYYIKKHKPTYVILAMGSGDMWNPNIISAGKKYMDEILSQVGDLPLIWIGPPNWKEDTGINKLIEQSVEDGAFFLSKNLKFDRVADGVHPTKKSASQWMDSVATFIMKKSAYPINLKFPKSKAKKSPIYHNLKPKPPARIK
jgi:hypothetical protein